MRAIFSVPVRSEARTRTTPTAPAALLVVGCGCRSNQGSPLLTSVSRGAIFLARCPVAVVEA